MLANAPHMPTAEQARVIRGLTSSGHGVETVEALAGTGKTFTAGPWPRPTRPAATASWAPRRQDEPSVELTEQAGIAQASTLARLALDLDPAASARVGRC